MSKKSEFEALLDARRCYVCGQRDDHPRDHVVLIDQSSAFHHIDCGARLNPPCFSCEQRLSDSGDATGDALRSFLTGGN